MKNAGHRFRLLVCASAITVILTATLRYGADYYMLDLGQRVLSHKHVVLRPSGSLGLKLGMLGASLFCCLYLYPIRKRSRWLQQFGKTKHWLDFHVLCGLSAPLIITLHSSFKLQGLAGVAYWLMMAVMLSGIVGRYFYAQLPRSLNAAVLSLGELAELSASTRRDIEARALFNEGDVNRVLAPPDAEQVERMSLLGALGLMIWTDIQRPFRVAALRRCSMTTVEKLRTLGGLFKSSDAELENAIRLVRRESWLLAKMAFLGRAQEVFQLWHVVHRPFSYSFAVLAVIHIVLVLAMGYY
jgi:hypothetical protein